MTPDEARQLIKARGLINEGDPKDVLYVREYEENPDCKYAASLMVPYGGKCARATGVATIADPPEEVRQEIRINLAEAVIAVLTNWPDVLLN